jgi:cytochrome d ubiquinol oxidase subunit I
MFVVVYAAVFGTGIGYLFRLIRIGPMPHAGEHPEGGGPGQERQPMRPLSAASESDLAESAVLTTRS